MEFLEKIIFWHWFSIGLVLLVLEMLVSGATFLWLGISAFIIGIVLYFIPDLHLFIQICSFLILSVMCLALFKKSAKLNSIKSDEPYLNRRGERYIGQTFVLDTAIKNGVGDLHINDTIWKVRSTTIHLPKGSKIKVVNVYDNTLEIIESA